MQKLSIAILIGLIAGIIIGVILVIPNPQNSFNVSDIKDHYYDTKTEEESTDNSDTSKKHQHLKITELKVATYFSRDLADSGYISKRLESKIKIMSNSQLLLTMKEPGTLVPPNKIFNAVKSGTIQAGFSPAEGWGHQVPALQLLSSMPFGPLPSEYLTWFYAGTGQKTYQVLLKKQNMHLLICGMTQTHSSGWFKKPINTLNDLKSATISVNGLAAKVIKKLGTKVIFAKTENSLNTIKSKKVEGMLSSNPQDDLNKEVNKIANYYYLPSWHDPVKIFYLIINLATWDRLETNQKNQIESACGDNLVYSQAISHQNKLNLLKNLTKKNVQLKIWPPKVLKALNDSWNLISIKESKKDYYFKKIIHSLQMFRQEYQISRELSKPALSHTNK